MTLTINGASQEIASSELTVLALLDRLGLTSGPVAVEINRVIVPRKEHATHLVHDADVIEIVHLVGGG